MNRFEFLMPWLFVFSCITGLVALILMGIHHYRFHYACQFCYKSCNTGTDWAENRIMHVLQTVLAAAMCFMAFYFWMFHGWKLWRSCAFGLIGPLALTLFWEGLIMVLVAVIGPQHKDK